MHDLSKIEECFKHFYHHLYELIPDGIFLVNLDLLNDLDLLHFQPTGSIENPLTDCTFQVIETPEKITLVNEEFLVWIIPDQGENKGSTYILIALNQTQPRLEAAIIASGIYNTAQMVLKILEKFLHDIRDNENTLSQFDE